jgi:hypothetical protein
MMFVLPCVRYRCFRRTISSENSPSSQRLWSCHLFWSPADPKRSKGGVAQEKVRWMRLRDRVILWSSGRFKKRRPPPTYNHVEVRIRSLERELLEHQVASQQQQFARQVAEEAIANLHVEVVRLGGEIQKRDARLVVLSANAHTSRHQTFLTTDMDIDVIYLKLVTQCTTPHLYC